MKYAKTTIALVISSLLLGCGGGGGSSDSGASKPTDGKDDTTIIEDGNDNDNGFVDLPDIGLVTAHLTETNMFKGEFITFSENLGALYVDTRSGITTTGKVFSKFSITDDKGKLVESCELPSETKLRVVSLKDLHNGYYFVELDMINPTYFCDNRMYPNYNAEGNMLAVVRKDDGKAWGLPAELNNISIHEVIPAHTAYNASDEFVITYQKQSDASHKYSAASVTMPRFDEDKLKFKKLVDNDIESVTSPYGLTYLSYNGEYVAYAKQDRLIYTKAGQTSIPQHLQGRGIRKIPFNLSDGTDNMYAFEDFGTKLDVANLSVISHDPLTPSLVTYFPYGAPSFKPVLVRSVADDPSEKGFTVIGEYCDVYSMSALHETINEVADEIFNESSARLVTQFGNTRYCVFGNRSRIVNMETAEVVEWRYDDIADGLKDGYNFQLTSDGTLTYQHLSQNGFAVVTEVVDIKQQTAKTLYVEDIAGDVLEWVVPLSK